MEQGLVINWENLPTYNTIMALAAGAALISLAKMVKDLLEKKRINPLGWAINLGVLGLILFTTGLHMTLTWPLAPDFPYDNIVFGEPSLALGVMALAMAIYFWTQREKIISEQQPDYSNCKRFPPSKIHSLRNWLGSDCYGHSRSNLSTFCRTARRTHFGLVCGIPTHRGHFYFFTLGSYWSSCIDNAWHFR